jgi:hypothetical protein
MTVYCWKVGSLRRVSNRDIFTATYGASIGTNNSQLGGKGVDVIMRQLSRTAGEGNFDFLMLLGDPPPDGGNDDNPK